MVEWTYDDANACYKLLSRVRHSESLFVGKLYDGVYNQDAKSD